MDINIEFKNLTDEDKDLIYNFVDEHPECLIKETVAGFDAIKMVEVILPSLITAFGTIIAAIITGNKKKPDDKRTVIVLNINNPDNPVTSDQDDVILNIFKNASSCEDINSVKNS